MIIPDFRLETRLLLGGVMAIAIVSSAQAVDTYAIGECRTATQSSGVEIRPLTTADSYLVNYHGDELRYKKFSFDNEDTKVTLIKAPVHGKVALADVPNVSNGQYHYMPEDGYIGRDNFGMQVEKDGVKVRIEYLIEALTDDEPTTFIGDDGERQGIYCHPDEWKISANTLTIDNNRLQTLTNAVGVNNTFTLNAPALTGGAIGHTTGNSITNAADYSWHISHLNDKYESTYSKVVSHSYI